MKKFERKLYQLFNYQKFANNPKLNDSLNFESKTKKEVSFNDLALVAGGTKKPTNNKNLKKEEKPKI